jgi:hypothetical protein
MRRMPLVLLALVLFAAGCSDVLLPDDDDDFAVPLVCGPEHEQIPCTRGVEEGVAYRFNLLTHCGVEWAYFDGRFWVPEPKVEPPSDWAAIEAGTMILKRRRVAFFEADKGGAARFVPAPSSYPRPPCA